MKQLFWKVQTIPQTEELEIDSKEFNLYKEKYREHNLLETDADVISDYYNKASKNRFCLFHSILLLNLKPMQYRYIQQIEFFQIILSKYQ